MAFMENPLLGLSGPYHNHHTSDYDYGWFNADALTDSFGANDSPAIVSEEEEFEKILMDAESIDSDDSPTPGVYAADLTDMADDLKGSFDHHTSRSARHSFDSPATPLSIRATFVELPSMISPDIDSENADGPTKSPSMAKLEDAFAPPRKSKKRKLMSRPVDPRERAQFTSLTYSMKRSRASRREILRRRYAFGNHPALVEFERHDVSQSQVWQFIAKRHDKSIPSLF